MHFNLRTFHLIALCGLALLGGIAAPVTTHAAIAYVQGNYGTRNSSASVNATYAFAQGAGHLSVVFVAWSDSTSTVQSIADTKGNTYVAAVGPTSSTGNATQRIYYAKNISSATAGGNTVTVTFNQSVAFPEIRIVEYSGADTTNPFDIGVGASGTGITQNSGSVTTTNANDLLVAGNYVSDVTAAAGSGYTLRLTSNFGEIIEDEPVTTTGSYSATSTQGVSGWWVMQMAAFRVASSGGDTTPPTAPGTPALTVVSSSQINLTWAASTDNVGVTGYRVESCSGTSCTTFTQISTPTATTYSATGQMG